MYLPAHFAEKRPEEIERIIEAYPLAAIIAQTQGGLIANHIPLLRDGTERLIGHIALSNDMHRDVADTAEVLCIFRAEHAYISPNWYPSKQAHHKAVPTWNYQAVHVTARVRWDHTQRFKRGIVGRLTKHFEAQTNGAAAWRMADAPADYMEAMLANIVGMELTIEKIVAKSKLNQNRDQADMASVSGQLEAKGNTALALAMRERLD